MKYDGDNVDVVLADHYKWVSSGGAEGSPADFEGAALQGANFAYFKMYGANFRGADLRRANFYQTDLTRADLTGANIFETNFYRAEVRGAIGLPALPMFCPDTGSFIAWKRIFNEKGRDLACIPDIVTDREAYENSIIVKLLIPEDAHRISMPNGECKADKVTVLELQTLSGAVLPPETVGYSIRDRKTEWRVGDTVTVPDFSDENYNMTHGLFFYLNRNQAVEYLTAGRDTEGNVKLIDWEKVVTDMVERNHY